VAVFKRNFLHESAWIQGVFYLYWHVANSEEFKTYIFKIFSICNTECLAKRWVKYTIVLVCVMLWRHLTLRSKGYFMRISMVVSVLKGGGGNTCRDIFIRSNSDNNDFLTVASLRADQHQLNILNPSWRSGAVMLNMEDDYREN
jgi:hypothetical protein